VRRRKPPVEPDPERLRMLRDSLRLAERIAAVSSGEWRARRQESVDRLRVEIAEEEARGA